VLARSTMPPLMVLVHWPPFPPSLRLLLGQLLVSPLTWWVPRLPQLLVLLLEAPLVPGYVEHPLLPHEQLRLRPAS